MQKIAEVIEAGTTEFVAQCYELYGLPSLGSMVKTSDGERELYGVVYNATTSSIEPGRRPIARGREETSEKDIYRSNPQLARLLRSEFSALIVGHRQDGRIIRYLPPAPARIHGFVYLCDKGDVKEFSQSFEFLPTLLNARLMPGAEEVTAAALRQMSQSHDDPRRFLVAAGKELAVVLGGDYGRLRVVLGRLGSDLRNAPQS
jgi:hypothetical protein